MIWLSQFKNTSVTTRLPEKTAWKNIQNSHGTSREIGNTQSRPGRRQPFLESGELVGVWPLLNSSVVPCARSVLWSTFSDDVSVAAKAVNCELGLKPAIRLCYADLFDLFVVWSVSNLEISDASKIWFCVWMLVMYNFTLGLKSMELDLFHLYRPTLAPGLRKCEPWCLSDH